MPDNSNVSVAVLLPCYNEEVTIGKVVRDFKAALPNCLSSNKSACRHQLI